MKTRKCLIVFAVLMLAFTGCAVNDSLVRTGYQVLSVSQQSYDVAMKSLIDLHAQGLVTDADFNEAIDAAEKYCTAHNVAVEALAKYKEGGDAMNRNNFEDNLILSSSLLGKLLNIVKEGGYFNGQ
jgi:hypothetical protein